MSSRTVTVDLTPQEARTVAAFLDMGVELVAACVCDNRPEDILELRDRFLGGIAIAEAEAVLRGQR